MNSSLRSGGGRGPLPGERLAQFEIERELGRGGMGIVYLARDLRLRRRVAIKLLPHDLALDPVWRSQFQQEARALAALNHPNIATLHGMEDDGRGSWFLVLEWVDGLTLTERLKAGPLAPGEALAVLAQVADALVAAHLAGILHRDLKPGNVMVLAADRANAGDRVKVLDFGIARPLARNDPSAAPAAPGQPPDPGQPPSPDRPLEPEVDVTHLTHLMMGTAAYLSPERVLGEPEDARSDLFSFGSLGFECLAGTPAFHGSSVLGTLTRIVKGEPDWSSLPANTPAEIRALLASCLEKSRHRRPADAVAVAQALSRARERRRPRPASGPANRTDHNLPRSGTSFIGRDRELGACLDLLDHARVISLVGPGGCGKTRLAVRVAELALERGWSGASAGAWFAPLAAIQESDPARLAGAVSTALGLRATAGRPLAVVTEHFKDRPALLVIDNCEQVLEGARELILALRDSCAGLTMVTTSTRPLALDGEARVEVEPFAVPRDRDSASPASAMLHDAVRLFTDRAALADEAFELDASNVSAICEVCRRVDGIPLAIELAAARIRALAPAEIASRLDQPLRLLRDHRAGSDPRHATLQAAIRWSVDLLAPPEQRAFRALSVFAGGWTLAGAAAVLGSDDELDALERIDAMIACSLVATERPRAGGTRYRYLEPIRRYALDALHEAGDEEREARRRHFEFFRSLVAGGAGGTAAREDDAWRDALESDHENVLGALEACALDPELTADALQMAASLLGFWRVRGHARAGRDSIQRLLERPAALAPTRERGLALYAFGALSAHGGGGFREAGPHFEAALAIFRAMNDRDHVARTLSALSAVATKSGDAERATALLTEADGYFREIGDRRGQAFTRANLAAVAWHRGDLAGAREHLVSAIALLRELGDVPSLSQACVNLSFVAVRSGDLAAARDALIEAAAIMTKLGARSTTGAGALLSAGELATRLGRYDQAARRFGAAEALFVEIGLRLNQDDPWWQERAASEQAIREALGDDRCDRALAGGRALGTAEALAALARDLAEP